MREKYCDDFHDTPGFRQFHAEYMCDFPAGKLDSTREFIDMIKKIQNWLQSKPVKLNYCKQMLIRRDTFLDEVFECREEWVEFTHNGFLGQEYIAIQEFFNFYQLKPPVVPLLQSEFRNPLFLHLVCDSFSSAGYEEIPRGRLGFQDMLNICIGHKNKILSKKCNCDPNIQIVRTTLSRIALQMAEKETSISMIPENILNAYYLENFLWNNEMCSRDSFWTYFLIENYKKKNSAWTIIYYQMGLFLKFR
ncbi:hypothetical protein MHK_008727 [Candidatus Magnetomorum sp. HK-1]|nr:hypothetical protein MHK_008727 [Candidatus Magnetomorum sp. HK-1]